MEAVIHVQPLNDYILKVAFNTGQIKLFDVKPYLDKGVFVTLKDKALFNQAYVDYDTVCWPGNLDIAPETLFDRGVNHTGV
jgi:Protein of unknown function (DUF2442)